MKIKPDGVKNSLGKGSSPLVKPLNDDEVICVWENEKQIHLSVVELQPITKSYKFHPQLYNKSSL